MTTYTVEDWQKEIEELVEGPSSGQKKKSNRLIQKALESNPEKFLKALNNLAEENKEELLDGFNTKASRIFRLTKLLFSALLEEKNILIKLTEDSSNAASIADTLTQLSKDNKEFSKKILAFLKHSFNRLSRTFIISMIEACIIHREPNEMMWFNQGLTEENYWKTLRNMIFWCEMAGGHIKPIRRPEEFEELDLDAETIEEIFINYQTDPETGKACGAVYKMPIRDQYESQASSLFEKVHQKGEELNNTVKALMEFTEKITLKELQEKWERILNSMRIAINEPPGDRVDIRWEPINKMGLYSFRLIRNPQQIKPPNVLFKCRWGLMGKEESLETKVVNGIFRSRWFPENHPIPSFFDKLLNWLALDAYQLLTSQKTNGKTGRNVGNNCTNSEYELVRRQIPAHLRKLPEEWHPREKADRLSQEVLGRELPGGYTFVESHSRRVKTKEGNDNNRPSLIIFSPSKPA